MSEVWCRFCDILDVNRSITSGYHARVDGQAEQTNQNVKQILHVAFIDIINWVCVLGTVEISINRVATISGFLPHYLNLGYEPTLLPDVEHSEVVENAIN